MGKIVHGRGLRGVNCEGRVDAGWVAASDGGGRSLWLGLEKKKKGVGFEKSGFQQVNFDGGVVANLKLLSSKEWQREESKVAKRMREFREEKREWCGKETQ